MATRIGVIGAGLIGRKHIGILNDDPAFELAGIADPSPQAEAYAREHGFPFFKEAEALLNRDVAPELRGWEWHYLQRRTHGNASTSHAHEHPVNAVAWSPDATSLASASADDKGGAV